MRGAGTLIFLAVFFLSVLATLAVPSIPPGKQIYGALGAPELEVAGTDYPIFGFSATVLIYAFFNGVAYGMIALLLFTIASMTKQKKPQLQQPIQPQ